MDIELVSTFFTIVNSSAINIHVQVFVWVSIFISLGYILRLELLDPIVTLCLTF